MRLSRTDRPKQMRGKAGLTEDTTIHGAIGEGKGHVLIEEQPGPDAGAMRTDERAFFLDTLFLWAWVFVHFGRALATHPGFPRGTEGAGRRSV